ncbi:MAG: response regulator transcription factor [Firmicutes bacterium]|nr:response regulator transcription factor [Bacillota bacterium]
MRILIVEDEVRLAEALSRLVQEEKYQTDMAHDGDEGLHLASSVPYDAIILDRMLPGKSGTEIVKALRAKGISTPVLLLTAMDSIADRVEGLNAGADDYLVKPFAMEELLARIRALVRRPTDFVPDEGLRFGDLELDLTRRVVSCHKTGCEENLSPKEALILEMLIRHAGQVLTRRQLMDSVWGYEADVLEGVLDTYVHHLRKRLQAVGGPAITTLRGVGYTLARD